jgi:hypothetical protein
MFLAACAEEEPPRSIEAFLADRVILDAVLARCNTNTDLTATEEKECLNARRAVERLLRQREEELALERKRQFEASREALRLRLEREEALRRAAEAEERARQLDVYAGTSFDTSGQGDEPAGPTAGDDRLAATQQPEAPEQGTSGAAPGAMPGNAIAKAPESGAAVTKTPPGDALAEEIQKVAEELQRRKRETGSETTAAAEDSERND